MLKRRVVIVGAGVAGLRAARVLADADVEVQVVEAAAAVGGRIQTEVIDGYRIDAGFQLLNPAYPQAANLDLSELALRPFEPGMIVADEQASHRIVDPLRRPVEGLSTLWAPMGTFRGRIALGILLARLRATRPSTRLDPVDRPARHWLLDQAIGRSTIDELLLPFLRGVLLSDDLTCSARLVALLLRSFTRGVPGVPALGMGALPAQMHQSLPAGTVRLSTPVLSVDRGGVQLRDDERVEADVVIVATSRSAAEQLVELPRGGGSRCVTNWWFASDDPLASGANLIVDAQGDALVNMVEMTAAAPSYAPTDRHLIACSVLGTTDSPAAERSVRVRAGQLSGAPSGSWDLIARSVIPEALPTSAVPLVLRPPIDFDGVLLAGDHVATPSIQGAMASGERAARVAMRRLSVPLSEDR